MSHKTATLTVQKWGNSLAIRIPVAIAQSAHFELGTLVKLDAHDGNIMVKALENQKLSLSERLALFDPETHGGESMPLKPIGLEKF